MRTLAVVVTLSLAVVSGRAASQSQLRSREAIIDGIRRHEISAVVEAERSADSTLLPFIVGSFLTGDPTRLSLDPEYVAASRRAIVALADRRQLQEMWCRAVREDALNPPVAPLGVVGGWFGIRGLQELLKPERQENHERALRRRGNRDRDMAYLSPQGLAMIALAETVANPPTTLDEALFGYPRPPLVRQWNDWIAGNRAELERLEPTGEGVDYSERACKNGKPVKG